jgi:hypothetical protein
MANIFDKPPEGTIDRQAYDEMRTGDFHTNNLYGEHGAGNGGEAIDPVTGRPNVDKEVPVIGSASLVRTREIDLNQEGEDAMGKLKDPKEMSLQELIDSQKED